MKRSKCGFNGGLTAPSPARGDPCPSLLPPWGKREVEGDAPSWVRGITLNS